MLGYFPKPRTNKGWGQLISLQCMFFPQYCVVSPSNSDQKKKKKKKIVGATGAHGIWQFQGHGSNPSHSCDLRHNCSNAGSLTHCAGTPKILINGDKTTSTNWCNL